MGERIINVGTTNDKLGKQWGETGRVKNENMQEEEEEDEKDEKKKEKILLISQRTLNFAHVNINECRSSYKSLITHYT